MMNPGGGSRLRHEITRDQPVCGGLNSQHVNFGSTAGIIALSTAMLMPGRLLVVGVASSRHQRWRGPVDHVSSEELR